MSELLHVYRLCLIEASLRTHRLGSVRQFGKRSVAFYFTDSQEGILFTSPIDRDLRTVFCESSRIYKNGSLGTYPNMPSAISSLAGVSSEVYRFYFWRFCLPKIPSVVFSHAINNAFTRRSCSLQKLQSLALQRLSTNDLAYIRQEIIVAI